MLPTALTKHTQDGLVKRHVQHAASDKTMIAQCVASDGYMPHCRNSLQSASLPAATCCIQQIEQGNCVHDNYGVGQMLLGQVCNQVCLGEKIVALTVCQF